MTWLLLLLFLLPPAGWHLYRLGFRHGVQEVRRQTLLTIFEAYTNGPTGSRSSAPTHARGGAADVRPSGNTVDFVSRLRQAQERKATEKRST